MKSKDLLLAVREHILLFLPEYSAEKLNIFIHNLPVQEVSEKESFFPFAIIRFDEKKLEENYTQDTVILALGVNENADQESAGLLLAELYDSLTRIFYENRIVGQCFEVLLPITLKQVEPEKKWHEFHFSSMELVFRYNTLPARPLGEEFNQENEVIL